MHEAKADKNETIISQIHNYTWRLHYSSLVTDRNIWQKFKDVKRKKHHQPTCFNFIEHSVTVEYVFFTNAHGTLIKIYCILGYETNINKFKTIEIRKMIFSDHNGKRQKENLQTFEE